MDCCSVDQWMPDCIGSWAFWMTGPCFACIALFNVYAISNVELFCVFTLFYLHVVSFYELTLNYSRTRPAG